MGLVMRFKEDRNYIDTLKYLGKELPFAKIPTPKVPSLIGPLLIKRNDNHGKQLLGKSRGQWRGA